MHGAEQQVSKLPCKKLWIARTLESGQATALVALILAVLLACVSVASDFGLFQNDRRKMQNAADSAAMAGEQEINAGEGDDAATAAKNDAALNGYTDGVGQITVAVDNPTYSGPHSCGSSAVEANPVSGASSPAPAGWDSRTTISRPAGRPPHRDVRHRIHGP